MSPNFWFYLILRLSSFVFATEPVGHSRRGPVGISSKNQKSISAGVSLALDGDLKDATDWLAFAMGWIWLAFNLYLSVFLNGIAEFPAYSLKAIMVDKFERAMLIFLDTRDMLSSERRGYTRRNREKTYAEGIGVKGRRAYWSRGGLKRGCISYWHAYWSGGGQRNISYTCPFFNKPRN